MEHERCYIYKPSEQAEHPAKRQRTGKQYRPACLKERLQVFKELWSHQEERVQATLEEAGSATLENIVNFISASRTSQHEQRSAIPTGLILAGPSIASHAPYFHRLGQKTRSETNSAYIVLTSRECPNLKTLLKNLIKNATSRTDLDDDDEFDGLAKTSRNGPKLLDFDLGHLHEWQRKNKAQSIVVAIQDSEAFDVGVLVEVVDLFYSWLDRLPFVLLFGIATSAESLEDRLSGKSLRYLEGQKFDVTQSDVIIEKLFSATIASTDASLRVGPNLTRRMLDRQKDHVQNVQDFFDGLKYAYMSHFYASIPSIFLKTDVQFKELSSDVFEAIRNLPSFRRRVENMLDNSCTADVRKLLESNQFLFEHVVKHIQTGKKVLNVLSHAAEILAKIRRSLQLSSNPRTSNVWTRAASGDIVGSPLLRETMLSIKKISSDKLVQLLDELSSFEGEFFSVNLDSFQERLRNLLKTTSDSTPLRTQHDVRNENVRTTVVAQKVLLSKHKATLSEEDKAYSDLVAELHDNFDAFFSSAFIDPRSLFLIEILMYDLKSPHTEVFQPKPRFAIERALASPHDYLGCECCLGVDGQEAALSATQPATAILYQMYLESGALINVSDLWSAFNAIATDDDAESESKTMALFQRSLAELKYLGFVKSSKKKTDHIAKMMWKGL